MLLSISRTLRAFLGLLTLSIFFVACHQNTSIDKDKKDHYDGPGEMWEQELEMIRDPRTGQVPWQKLFEAKQRVRLLVKIVSMRSVGKNVVLMQMP
jgi:hypothetical protein